MFSGGQVDIWSSKINFLNEIWIVFRLQIVTHAEHCHWHVEF
jgi:hypothetical protein